MAMRSVIGTSGELPEGVVEEEVERDEDAEHGDLLEQEEDVEELLALGDGVPGDEDAERGEESGEDDEPHGEAVDAEVVADGGGVDPGDVLIELDRCRRCGVDEAGGQVQGKTKVSRVTASAPHCMILPAVRQEGEQERAGERGEDDDREDGVV